MAAHLIAVAVPLGFTVLVLLNAAESTALFALHPILMSLAYALFMNEAIMVFSPSSSIVGRKVSIVVAWRISKGPLV